MCTERNLYWCVVCDKPLFFRVAASSTGNKGTMCSRLSNCDRFPIRNSKLCPRWKFQIVGRVCCCCCERPNSELYVFGYVYFGSHFGPRVSSPYPSFVCLFYCTVEGVTRVVGIRSGGGGHHHHHHRQCYMYFVLIINISIYCFGALSLYRRVRSCPCRAGHTGSFGSVRLASLISLSILPCI